MLNNLSPNEVDRTGHPHEEGNGQLSEHTGWGFVWRGYKHGPVESHSKLTREHSSASFLYNGKIWLKEVNQLVKVSYT